MLASRDSDYMIGSVGTGRATLTIDGEPARVYPNGAFMAWVRNPTPAKPMYDLVAIAGTDTVRAQRPVRFPPPAPQLPATGPIAVDSASLLPRPGLMLRDDERTEVGVRAPANAVVTLHAGAARLRLTHTGDDWSLSTAARFLRAGAQLVVSRGRDSIRLKLPGIDAPNDTNPKWVRLGKGQVSGDTDAVVYGRVLPNDNYHWFLLPGTVLQLTGHVAGYSRVRADRALEMWVADADVEPAASAMQAPRRVTNNARLRATSESVDLVIPMTAPPAYYVEEGGTALGLVLYGTRANSDIINLVTADTFVRNVTWDQEASDRVRFTLHLTRPALGYLALWENGSFVLRVRRAPSVDPAQPLRGLTIAIDPGHPPAGATGPTSLYEGQAVLWVGERVQALLEQRGAHVIMTRTTMDSVPLTERRVIARRANAQVFVSIHLNAYPDGVNPFTAKNGSGTYFFRPYAEPLARAVQRGVLATMGLPDDGVFVRSLAVTVQSWMPAVLCEGAFVIIPEQEAALRTPEFQDKYAQGIVNGLEAYFRSFAR